MSVIGYLITCQRCEARMLVTSEAKHTQHCPDCLHEMLLEAISEVVTDNDDQDYPIGEVQG
jgi:hypothetical protein